MLNAMRIDGVLGEVDSADLDQVVRAALADPTATALSALGMPLAHRISAPTTRGLTRVQVSAQSAKGPATVHCIAKELQAARYGLPPQMPDHVRRMLDGVIPWRREAEIYESGLSSRMPDGIRMPQLLGHVEQPDDRSVLWLEDVESGDAPWTAQRTAFVADRLGSLAARRRKEPVELPADSFFEVYLDQVRSWALPRLADDETWRHPAFAARPVQALRARIDHLAHRVEELVNQVRGAIVLPAHGDPTPMNILSPNDTDLVLIDWGSSTPAPVGFDLLPLVFGLAEAGTAPASELPGLLATALPAYRAGLAAEDVRVQAGDLAATVVRMAQLRYVFTSLPLAELEGWAALTESQRATAEQHGVDRADFVTAVLDLTVEAVS